MNSFFKSAQAAFDTNDYAQAILLYEQAMAAYPALAEFYRFNLNQARAKLDMPPAPVMLTSLYYTIAKAAPLIPPMDAANAPLVSVLMTAHNVADYIEAAVTSVLRQTWPRLELIVVDDASSDATWTILQRLEVSEFALGLRCRRLNSNLGTYFAKKTTH